MIDFSPPSRRHNLWLFLLQSVSFSHIYYSAILINGDQFIAFQGNSGNADKFYSIFGQFHTLRGQLFHEIQRPADGVSHVATTTSPLLSILLITNERTIADNFNVPDSKEWQSRRRHLLLENDWFCPRITFLLYTCTRRLNITGL